MFLIIRFGNKVLVIFNYSKMIKKDQQYDDIMSLYNDGINNNNFEIIAIENNSFVNDNVSNIFFIFTTII